MSNADKYVAWIQRYTNSLTVKPKTQEIKKSHKPNVSTRPTVLPAFSGTAEFLGGDLGKAIHKAVQAKYGSYEPISKVVYDAHDKLVKGSNPFYVAAVSEILIKKNIPVRVAAQDDLEKILKSNVLSLKDHYEDTALVWRSNDEPNNYLASDIYNQCKAHGMTLKQGTPYIFPLYALKLKEDQQSPHKLSFDMLGVFPSYIPAPILNSRNGSYIKSTEIDPIIGLPTKVYDRSQGEDRRLWTQTDGLSRFYLNRNLDVNSNNGNLASSNDDGRVVLVSAAGAAPVK